jgi:AraC-like DNA-binding protein
MNTEPEFFSSQIALARRFYLNPKPVTKLSLLVVSGGVEQCAPEYEIERSSFPYYAVEYVAQGSGTLLLGGRPYALRPGTLFTYGPGVSQVIRPDPAEPMAKYFVDFTGRNAAGLLAGHGLDPGSVVQTKAPGELISAWEEMIRNGLRDTPFRARMVAALFDYLLLKIAESAIPFGTSGTPALATYQRCRQAIEDRFLSLHTLEGLASECHVDPAYLCRLFRRFDHESPYRLLIRMKMRHAAQRLQTGGVSVKQAAGEVGFDDPAHFSRVFKKTEGLAPAHFVRFSQRGE